MSTTLYDKEALTLFASKFAQQLEPGDLISLEGDLGVGKTFFVSKCLEALGVKDTVTSPTFTIVNIYETKEAMRLLHGDLYRLDEVHELENTGAVELFPESVTFLEWGDKFADSLEFTHRVDLDFGQKTNERTIKVTRL